MSLPIYFLVISAATILASLWFLRRAHARNLNSHTAIDLTIVVLIGGFIGARLLHVLWEDPAYYRSNPIAAFEVWNGGFVYLGGVVGAWLAALLFCQRRSEPFLYWADTATPAIALGYSLGRIGCLLNGCCYGRYCELPWALGGRHPTQVYASLWELVAVGILLAIEPRSRISGTLFHSWLVMHAIGRIVMEVFRDDPRGPMIMGMSLGTWMSLGLGLWGALRLSVGPRVANS